MKIGIGGHQDLGGAEVLEFLESSFRELLKEYRPACVYSALAKGADQLLMQVALDLGVPVEVVIPCKGYEHNYQGDDQIEYWRLYHAARTRHHLDFQKCGGSAYEAAGHWIVEQSDLTVLAWNGKPPAGRGGTADMAHYARFLGRPFVHLHTIDCTATSYQFTQSAAAAQGVLGETGIGTVLILPVVRGKKEVVLLVEQASGLGFVRCSQDSYDALQQVLRRDMGYEAGRFEVLGSLEGPEKVEVVVAGDLVWAPISSERPVRMHTRDLTDVLVPGNEGEHVDATALEALFMYAQAGKE